jgi:hypothetical protein
MLFKFESGVGSAMQAPLTIAIISGLILQRPGVLIVPPVLLSLPTVRTEVNCFEQKIAKSRWTFATKGKISADWKLGSNQHQSLRALCDLL